MFGQIGAGLRMEKRTIVDTGHDRFQRIALRDGRARAVDWRLLQEIAGDLLDQPRMSWDPVPTIDKPSGKMREQPSKRKSRRRRRKR